MGDLQWRSWEFLWKMKLMLQKNYSLCFFVSMSIIIFWLSDLVLLYVILLSGVNMESAMLHDHAAVSGRPGRGTLRFPEICTMELQLLATGSPDVEVLSHVFHSLLSAVHANHRNADLLYNQVRVTTSPFLCCYSIFHLIRPFVLTVLLAVLWGRWLTFCSDPHRGESKQSCLAFTVSSAKQTPPSLVCYFFCLSFILSDAFEAGFVTSVSKVVTFSLLNPCYLHFASL